MEMTIKRFITNWSAALCVALPALAGAGEVVVFEHGNFAGRSVTIAGALPDLSVIAMRNTISSLSVKSGTWEFCTTANYQGTCRQYTVGQYAEVGALNDRFASVREVTAFVSSPAVSGAYASGATSLPESTQAGARTIELILFEHANFEGQAKAISGSTGDLAALRFNDMASSLIVISGTWQLCTDANFAGECRTYPAGEYRTLEAGVNDRFSSARPVASSGTGIFGGSNTGSTGAPVTLFEYSEFLGRSLAISANVKDLAALRFNDRVSSMIIESGTWEFCTDADFRGECRTFTVGRYNTLPKGMSNAISSVRSR